ncbi:hypothetical protein FSC37_03820 [Piscinibacter aquaticus]|uniref:Uncharacterized protein n=1 Tax=Piscinibacter aquaticus TaxID=392597 RepID=A0A5C6U193_9BURK|nr:hypothetical protein FSC37_03820 [Piscinibacter aquaticus]
MAFAFSLGKPYTSAAQSAALDGGPHEHHRRPCRAVFGGHDEVGRASTDPLAEAEMEAAKVKALRADQLAACGGDEAAAFAGAGGVAQIALLQLPLRRGGRHVELSGPHRR